MAQPWQQQNAETMPLGLVSLVVVYLPSRRLSRLVPSPLVALLVGTLVGSLVFGNGSVSVLGDIPTGLPSL
jgi:SulP family sulfate permease